MSSPSEKLRVAVLGLRGIPNVQGGIEKHCEQLYPRIVKRNCKVTILGRKPYTPAKKKYDYKGVQIVPLWAPKSKYLEAILHTTYGVIWLVFHKNKFDLVHIHAIGPSLLSYSIRKLGFRLIFTHHGPDYERKKWGTFAKSFLRIGEKIGAIYANIVIAISHSIKRDLVKKYGTNSVYIPNGVNIPKKIPAGETLASFGLQTKNYIITVGRVVPEKGFHDLIEAYSQIKTSWKLVIVGQADHEDSYSKELKHRASMIDGVVLTGFQMGDVLTELYSNAGLFVLPSYHEGLPIVGLEAMSYGLPMLLSDISANREIAEDGELYSVGNVSELADRIKKFIEGNSLLNASKNQKLRARRIEEEFNWDLIATQTAGLYMKLAKSIH